MARGQQRATRALRICQNPFPASLPPPAFPSQLNGGLWDDTYERNPLANILAVLRDHPQRDILLGWDGSARSATELVHPAALATLVEGCVADWRRVRGGAG